MSRQLRVAFNAGELSPLAAVRMDLDVYQRGASSILNMEVGQMGGVKRRRGTVRVADAVGVESRVLPFVFSTDDGCLVELFPGGWRVLSRDGVELRRGMDGPWGDAAAVRGVRWQQINDVVYLVGVGFAPRILKRFSDRDWRLEAVGFDRAPEMTSLLQEEEMVVDGGALSWSGVGEVEAGDVVRVSRRMSSVSQVVPVPVDGRDRSPLDRAVLAGVAVQWDDGRSVIHYYTCVKDWSPSYKGSSDDPGDYPEFFRAGMFRPGYGPLPCEGGWSVVTSGNWEAGLYVVRKRAKGATGVWGYFDWSWEVLRYMESSAGNYRNYNNSGREDELCRVGVVVVWMKWNAELNIGAPQLDVDGFDLKLFCRVVSVSGGKAFFRNEEDVGLGGVWRTYDWSLGAFSARNGFPCAVGFHQDRIWFAGTRRQPQTLWASAVGDYGMFDVERSGDDAALRFTLTGGGQNRICWMEPMAGVAVGTTDAEWALGSREGVLKAGDAFFNRQSAVGSADLDALTIENGLVFVQRNGRRLRQYAYSLEADRYVAEDLTVFADHVLDAGVVEMGYQRCPDPVLWCVLGDGSCACMTYNMLQNVKAWGRFVTAGEVRSVAVLPRADGGMDEVYLVEVRGDRAVVCVIREGNGFVDWGGVDYVSEVVTNDLPEAPGERSGGVQVDVFFNGTPADGVMVRLGGEWGRVSGGKGVMDGWVRVVAPGAWSREMRVGVRVCGDQRCEVLGVVVNYAR